MGTRNFWELNGKKKTIYLLEVAVAFMLLNPIHEKGLSSFFLTASQYKPMQ